MQNTEFETMTAHVTDFLAKMRIAIGLALLAAGVLIAIFPQILVILLATIVISTGLGTILSGWRMLGRARPTSRYVEATPVHDAFDR